jgi:hypothetical protein
MAVRISAYIIKEGYTCEAYVPTITYLPLPPYVLNPCQPAHDR